MKYFHLSRCLPLHGYISSFSNNYHQSYTPLCSQFSNSNIDLHINEDSNGTRFCSLQIAYTNLPESNFERLQLAYKFWVSTLSSFSQIVFINSGPGWYFAKKKQYQWLNMLEERKVACHTFSGRFTLYLRTVLLKVLKSPAAILFNPLCPKFIWTQNLFGVEYFLTSGILNYSGRNAWNTTKDQKASQSIVIFYPYFCPWANVKYLLILW